MVMNRLTYFDAEKNLAQKATLPIFIINDKNYLTIFFIKYIMFA